MRKAVLVMGLVLSLFIMGQSWLVGLGGEMFDDPFLARGGAMGRLIGILFIMGAAFVLAKPVIAMAVYLIGGFISFFVAVSTGYYDLVLWGAISLTLALMSFYARREIEETLPPRRRVKRKKKKKVKEEDVELIEVEAETEVETIVETNANTSTETTENTLEA